jgi:hypothetical protein
MYEITWMPSVHSFVKTNGGNTREPSTAIKSFVQMRMFPYASFAMTVNSACDPAVAIDRPLPNAFTWLEHDDDGKINTSVLNACSFMATRSLGNTDLVTLLPSHDSLAPCVAPVPKGCLYSITTS